MTSNQEDAVTETSTFDQTQTDQTEDQGQDQPHPSLRCLDVLVGTWRVSGGEPGTKEEITGTSTYEWMEGGFYLVQHVDMVHGGRPVRGVEYIGYDPEAGTLRSYFFGNQSPGPFARVALEYVYEVTDDTITIWGGDIGSPAAYRATFRDGRDSFAGAWEWPGGGYEATSTRTG